MAATKRPGALDSDRAGNVVLGGTLPDSTRTPKPQRCAEIEGKKTERLATENPPTVKICRCRYCGNEFTAVRKSASYCSEAHKRAFLRSGLAGQNQQREGRQVLPYIAAPKAHFSPSQAVEYAASTVPLMSILKRIPPDPPDGWRFKTVNEVMIKLTDGMQERTPGSLGQWGGFNVSRARAFLTEIGWAHGGGNRWIVRSGNHSLGPFPLHIAKRASVALATGVIEGRSPGSDPIERLNRLSAGVSTVWEEVIALGRRRREEECG